jgi:hypothetical protein
LRRLRMARLLKDGEFQPQATQATLMGGECPALTKAIPPTRASTIRAAVRSLRIVELRREGGFQLQLPQSARAGVDCSTLRKATPLASTSERMARAKSLRMADSEGMKAFSRNCLGKRGRVSIARR